MFALIVKHLLVVIPRTLEALVNYQFCLCHQLVVVFALTEGNLDIWHHQLVFLEYWATGL